jgi:hypothetical protein
MTNRLEKLKSLGLKTFFVVSGENEIINCWYHTCHCINFKHRIYVCCSFFCSTQKLDVIAALIGAISGSLGGNIISDWLRRRNEKDLLRKTITDRYLLQLQDSIESLWFRLDSIKGRGGGLIMDNLYYEESTLYALGIVFAYNRILLLEGIYSQVELLIPSLGTFLKEKLRNIESGMDSKFRFRTPFYRLALADSVLQRQNGKPQTSTYLEFKEKYETQSNIKSSLQPATEFVASLNESEVGSIMKELSEIAFRVEAKTRIPTSIKEK